jgi:hypothetical protein
MSGVGAGRLGGLVVVLAALTSACGSATLPKTGAGGQGGNSAGAAGGGAKGTGGAAGTAGAGGVGGVAGASPASGGSGGGGAAGGGMAGAAGNGATAGAAGGAAGGGAAGSGAAGIGGNGGAGATCAASDQCVASGTGVIGVLTAATGTCPTGFGVSETLLYQNPDGGQQCTGCTCAGSITCTATIYTYTDTSSCQIDSAMTGGSATATLDDAGTTNKCTLLHSGTGHRLSAYQGTTACTTGGTPVAPAIAWGGRTKFCAASSSYPKCADGVCLPATTTQPLCILLDGAATCPAAYPAYQGTTGWYAAFTDGRTCTACGCTLQDAGSCAAVQMYYSSINCSAGDPQSLPAKICSQTDPANIYTVGQGTAPACTTGSTVAGSVALSARKTLCCAN